MEGLESHDVTVGADWQVNLLIICSSYSCVASHLLIPPWWEMVDNQQQDKPSVLVLSLLACSQSKLTFTLLTEKAAQSPDDVDDNSNTMIPLTDALISLMKSAERER